ncbi:MAG: MmgE/PrpD family protein, partial [Firmicutes bacterium]|nr:MmgE/PrpD family protein [Bacillota bacterium]
SEYQSNGAWTKRLNPANATKAGVFAARLAKAGFFGPETILEGKAGFLQAYSNSFSLDFLKTDTKNGFQIEKVSRKPYPSCRHTHASIDAVFNIKSKNQIDCSKINEIIVESYDRVVEATVKPENRKYRPQTEVDGQFSLPFCLSIALHFGQITPEHFTTPFLSNKSILKTASKVKVRGIKEFNELYPAQNPSRVIIRTDTGEYSDTVYEAKGDPGNPLVSEKIDEKFVMLVSSIFGNDVNYHYLLKQLRQLEEIDTVHDLSYF